MIRMGVSLSDAMEPWAPFRATTHSLGGEGQREADTGSCFFIICEVTSYEEKHI